MFQFDMLCTSGDTTAMPADVKILLLLSCAMSFFL